MRTTIDLPSDLHRLTSSLARSRRQTLSQLIADILRDALLSEEGPRLERDAVTGLPAVRIGRPVTSDDVAALEDE